MGVLGPRDLQSKRLRKTEQRLFQHRQLEAVRHIAPLLFRFNQRGVDEHRKVGRHGGLGDVEHFRKLPRADRSGLQ
jgi:hypothetical protein